MGRCPNHSAGAGRGPSTPADFDNDWGMWGLKVGNTYRLMGNDAKARSYGEISAAVYAMRGEKFPDDPQQEENCSAALALAEAGGGSRQFGADSWRFEHWTLTADGLYLQEAEVAAAFSLRPDYDANQLPRAYR